MLISEVTGRNQDLIPIRGALSRDINLFGSPEAVSKAYERRYIPGQRIYLESECPFEKASVIVVIDYTENRELVWWSPARPTSACT